MSLHSSFSEWEISAEGWSSHWLSMKIATVWKELCILMTNSAYVMP